MAGETLRITSGSMAGQTIPIENEFTVGRAETGMGNFGDDTQLSRHHARFRRLDTGQVMVEDLGSTNGTYVNGERISAPRILQPGDKLTLGRTTLEFEGAAAAATPPTAAQAPAAAAGAGAAAGAAGAGAARPAAAAGPVGRRAPQPTADSGGIRARMIVLPVLLVLIVGGVVAAIVATSSSGSSLSTSCEKSTPRTKAGPGHFVFITSACENKDHTVAKLRLFRGTSGGKTVWYTITDSSDKNDAARRGVNFAPKLKNAIGSPGIQNVTMNSDGTINFPATVDFNHKRVLVPGPTGFPPAKAAPPAVGAPTYSPLIKLPNGLVLNAPQVANDTGQADKVIKIDKGGGKVWYHETEGRYEDKVVHYMSFDAGTPVAAAIEDVTFAPAMNKVPTPGKDALNNSAREVLVAFVDGPLGKDNPQRQGLNSAILDKMDPLNILKEVPLLPNHDDIGAPEYAPMWDVHLAKWTPDAIAAGSRVRLEHIDDFAPRITDGVITDPNGAHRVGASNFDVNCPPISVDVP